MFPQAVDKVVNKVFVRIVFMVKENEQYLTEKYVITPKDPRYMDCYRLSKGLIEVYNLSVRELSEFYKSHSALLNRNILRKNVRSKVTISTIPTKLICRTIESVYYSFKASLSRKGADSPKVKTQESFVTIMCPKDSIGVSPRMVNGKWRYLISSSHTNLYFDTRHKGSVKEVFIKRVGKNYVMSMVYTTTVKPHVQSSVCASIDLGLDNLMAIYFSTGKSILYKGAPMKMLICDRKSQLYMEKLKGRTSKKRIDSIDAKYKNRMRELIRKTANHLLNEISRENVSMLIIGDLPSIKGRIGVRSVFGKVPYHELIRVIEYKCNQAGIRVLKVNESYTSRASSLDFDPLVKMNSYSGRRKGRGLYETKSGIMVNADVNGAINIMRKVFPEEKRYFDGIEGAAVSPRSVIVDLKT